MSLILGAVQFGVDYGVTNQAGKPSEKIAFGTIDTAWDLGIRTLDSAQAYGEANTVVARYHQARDQRFSVINKIMRYPQSLDDVRKSLLKELRAMNINRFDCIMFHHASSISFDLPISFVEELKTDFCDRLGVSIDTSEDYHILAKRFNFDVVQLPLNVLNQNFMPDDFLQDLKERSIEIHVRSAFLQGVLLSTKPIPNYLRALQPNVEKFQNDCKNLDISLAAGCFLFLLQKPAVDHVVVGAQNAVQLEETVYAYKMAQNAFEAGKTLPWQNYACDDFDLIYPACWPDLQKKAALK